MLSLYYYIQVRKFTIKGVKKRTGDVKNEIDVLEEYSLQFAYCGQSFRWMLENALDLKVGWFVDTICNEMVTNPTIPVSQNKAALMKYVESFK